MNKILKIVHYNVQSFRNSFLDFEVLLNNLEVDCLCLNEHWLLSDELNTIFIKNYKAVSGFCRSTMNHGGVSIYSRDGLSSKSLNLENMSVEKHCEITGIILKKWDMQLITVYRTPDGDFNEFLNILTNVFKKLIILKPIIITGDFNVHFNEKDNRALELCNFFRSFNLTKTVKFNTRESRCLDNIFTNIDCSLTASEPVDLTHTSDHMGILFKCNILDQNPQTRIIFRPITDEGLFMLYNKLRDYNFAPVINKNLHIDVKFQLFFDILTQTIDSSFPEKSKLVDKCISSNENQWFDEVLREMREKLQFLISLNKQNPTVTSKKIVSDYRKRYRSEIKKAKIESNENFINNSKNPQRAMWNLIKNKSQIPSERNTSFDANTFNNFFCSIAENIINKLDNPQIPFQDFLSKMNNADFPKFKFRQVTFIEVREAITALKNSSSKDSYDVNTKIIKTIKDLIIVPLTKLINESITYNIFPSVLKTSKVIPLYKGKGSVNDISNYRPISLTPILSKVYERLLKNQMSEHFESNNLFTISQFGFRKNKTTSLAVDCFTSDILEGFENYLDTHASFLDLTKAFDCVSHNILLEKLLLYNLANEAVSLICSYLSNRKQYVHFNHEISQKQALNFGVPQGSVLGPILFLIYINDLVYSQQQTGENIKFCLFADDTTYYRSYHPSNIDNVDFKNFEERMDQWFLANKLCLNDSKSQTMNFTLRHKGDDHPALVNCVKEVKFLGVYLDPGLTWEHHIVQLTKKLSQYIFLFRNLIKIISLKTILTAYHGYFHSILSYAILTWGHSCHTNKVFAIQRKCIRIIGKLGYRTECRHCFIELKILTVPCIYILQCLLYVKQNINIFKTHKDFHLYPTRNNFNIVEGFSRLERSRNGTRYLAIKFFNALPVHIRSLESNMFKNKIKNYLIVNAFYSFEEYFKSHFNM